jgi:hypothetical protein
MENLTVDKWQEQKRDAEEQPASVMDQLFALVDQLAPDWRGCSAKRRTTGAAHFG